MTKNVEALLYGCTGQKKWNSVIHSHLQRKPFTHLFIASADYVGCIVQHHDSHQSGQNTILVYPGFVFASKTRSIYQPEPLSVFLDVLLVSGVSKGIPDHFPWYLNRFCTIDGLMLFQSESACKTPFLYDRKARFLWLEFHSGPCHFIRQSSNYCCDGHAVYKPPVGWYIDPQLHPRPYSSLSDALMINFIDTTNIIG